MERVGNEKEDDLEEKYDEEMGAKAEERGFVIMHRNRKIEICYYYKLFSSHKIIIK